MLSMRGSRSAELVSAVMISAIIRADRGGEALAATLAALVPAVADGVLRDAVVVDEQGSAETYEIADAAGTRYLEIAPGEDVWRRGAEEVRGPWLLLIAAGDLPEPAWAAAAERFIRTVGPQGSAVTGARFRGSWGSSFRSAISSLIPGRARLTSGLLISKNAVLQGHFGRVRLGRLAATVDVYGGR
jgi:hypothetical protein